MAGGESSASGNDPRWYCLRNHQPIGPFSTEELVGLIEQKRLSDFDTVRLSGSEEWTSVRDIKQLLLAGQSGGSLTEPEDSGQRTDENARGRSGPDQDTVVPLDAAPQSGRGAASREDGGSHEQQVRTDEGGLKTGASSAAAEVLADADRRRLHHKGGELHTQNKRNPVAGLLSSMVELLELALGTVLERVVWAGKLWQVQLVAGLLLIGLFVWQVILPRLPVPAPQVHGTFQGLFKQLKTYASEGADEGSWSQLEQDVRSAVTKWSPQLQHGANSMRPDLLELMWSAEAFSAAVRELRTEAESRPNFDKLAIHLANAGKKITRRAELSQEYGFQSNGSLSSDGIFYGVVAIDVALGVGVAVFFLRRRLAR